MDLCACFQVYDLIMLSVNLVAHNGCRNHGQIPQLLMKKGKNECTNSKMCQNFSLGLMIKVWA
jgi:hypothetical protein